MKKWLLILFLLFTLNAFGQASVSLSPVAKQQFFDATGVPIVGGKLYTYQAGSSTLQATYTTSSGSIANANPIILNADGRPPNEIWMTSGQAYKFVLELRVVL